MDTRVVLITGGLTGIGRATALAFAKEGAQVVVSGRRDEEGQKFVSEIRKAGAEAEFIRADVRREEDVRHLVDKTVERFGRLDVAVNTAGTEGVPGPITEQTEESYAATFDTNVLGTLLSIEARTSRDAATKKRQHREHILHIWTHRRAWGFCLLRQQACSRGTHEISSAGSGGGWRPRECHRPRPDRDGYAESIHRNCRKKGRISLDGAAQTRGETRRDRADHRLSLFRQGVIHHGRVLPR